MILKNAWKCDLWGEISIMNMSYDEVHISKCATVLIEHNHSNTMIEYGDKYETKIKRTWRTLWMIDEEYEIGIPKYTNMVGSLYTIIDNLEETLYFVEGKIE